MRFSKELLFFGIFLMIFSLATLSAVSVWPLNKSETCNFFNLTESTCDQRWCEINEGNYSLEKEICEFVVVEIVNQTINETITINKTINSSSMILNSSDFYNKSEIDDRILNLSANTISRNEFQNFRSESSETNWGAVMVIGTFVFLIIVVVLFLMTRPKPIPTGFTGQPTHAKIQNPQNKEVADRLKKLEEQLKEKEEKKKAPKKQEKEKEIKEDNSDDDEEFLP